MNIIRKSLGSALLAAGLMSSVQAALITIDFDETSAQLRGPASGSESPHVVMDDIQPGDVITTQYSKFGLTFSGNNRVVHDVTPPGVPPNGSPTFLMNSSQGADFSIDVLPGFSLSSMVLDVAANTRQFTIRVFDDAGSSEFSLPFGTGGRWTTKDLLLSTNTRRIEFDASPSSSFSIDFLRFEISGGGTNVPEPAALSLVALAMACVGLSRRRKA